MTPLVAVLPTSPAEQLDVLLSLYSRITGFVTDADWQRIGFARLKAGTKRTAGSVHVYYVLIPPGLPALFCDHLAIVVFSCS